MKARDMETRVNELNTEITTIGTNFTNLKQNLEEDSSSQSLLGVTTCG